MAYIDKHGVEYTDDKKTLVRCPEDFEGEYIIPDGVESIAPEAFADCTGLTTVTVPGSVTRIAGEAFRGCHQLQEVSLLGGNIYIELDVFADCESLNSIDISSNLRLDYVDNYFKPLRNIININYDGDNQYAPFGALALNGYKEGPLYFKDASKKILLGCEKNYKGEIVIPESVVEIGECAFKYCTHITDIILHDNITTIGSEALPKSYKVGWDNEGCTWYIPFGTYEKFKEKHPLYSYNFDELDIYGQKFDSIGGLKEGEVPSYKEVQENGIESFIFPEDTRRLFTRIRDGRSVKVRIYLTGEAQSLTLLDEDSRSTDRAFYINNYIEDVDVNYVRQVNHSLVKCENRNKRYDDRLIFKAPLPNTKPAIGKIVELTYCGQNLNYRYTEYVWSTPIAINVDDIACIVETRLRCYEGMHSGCRIMLLGGKSDQLAKQELPCYVDVWEDYDFVLQKLLQAGWMR